MYIDIILCYFAFLYALRYKFNCIKMILKFALSLNEYPKS